MTAYDGQTITTDSIGNVTNDGVRTYTWEHGRQLVVTSSNGMPVSYAYNADGQRVSKSVAGFVTNFHYAGDKLAVMTPGADVLEFGYDALGPATLTYNGTLYYYLRNAQGDITGIVNSSGTQVVAYTYDAWGNILSVTGSMATTLGTLNPFRYRSYFYDAETNLYYLNSRYYNPQWGRFISADAYASTGQGMLGDNMFAYCGNNPSARIDPSGEFFFTILGAAIGGIAGAVDAWMRGEDILKGAIAGAVSGGIAGAGVDLGVLITVSSGGALLPLGLGVAGAMGAAGSAIGTGISSDWTAEPVEYLISGTVGGLTNMLSFGLAPINGEVLKAGISTTVKEVFKEGCGNLWENISTGFAITIGATWIHRGIMTQPQCKVFP